VEALQGTLCSLLSQPTFRDLLALPTNLGLTFISCLLWDGVGWGSQGPGMEGRQGKTSLSLGMGSKQKAQSAEKAPEGG
jgi:hypothetical protein